ncbi:hypothetical protein K505DRAFT_126305 [Melanomma pulvis-pyrius CBS 109.77]|uniref:Uncharacterized protein n=1 Tax=Melanomma pulvis-pyrius CBS 109.77 TaxID=1314802 RepID=A0A6A6XNJ7_9PLEO|nr:hypothetical protein K505DRAFT_126305 [Melanomma pulvis-pyrius CBS 109.77]
MIVISLIVCLVVLKYIPGSVSGMNLWNYIPSTACFHLRGDIFSNSLTSSHNTKRITLPHAIPFHLLGVSISSIAVLATLLWRRYALTPDLLHPVIPTHRVSLLSNNQILAQSLLIFFSHRCFLFGESASRMKTIFPLALT